MSNEEVKDTDVQEDQTSDTSSEDTKNDQGEDSPDVKTLTAQKNKWKDKAVDKESGKTYKELYEESQKKPESETETPKQEEQSDGTDYAKLAYLKTEGVEHPDDRKIVLDEANRLKMPIEEVLAEKHIKARLKDAKDQREAEAGMPEGSKGTSTGNKGSVDYWLNRKDKDGNFVTPPDTKLANEVIDARLKQHEESNMFDEPRV